MKKTLKWTVVIISTLFILGMMTSILGCGKTEVTEKVGEESKPATQDVTVTEEAEETEEESLENNYESSKEVTPSGLAKEINSELKSILTEAFDGAKLTGFTNDYGEPGTAELDYIVKNQLKDDDGNDLSNALQERNYTIKEHEIGEANVAIKALKDNRELRFYYWTDDNQEISVNVKE